MTVEDGLQHIQHDMGEGSQIVIEMQQYGLAAVVGCKLRFLYKNGSRRITSHKIYVIH
jgi:hypothetical protein